MNISSITVPMTIKKAMCSPKLAEIAENTVVAVSVETVLKMAGRPTFILTDKKADAETKKYAAVKEFLYQGTCLGLYLGIVPYVKKGINKLIMDRLAKNPENAESIKEYHAESKLVENAKQAYKKTGSFVERTFNKTDAMKTAKETWHKAEKALKEKIGDVNNPKMNICKGSKELSAIIGSVVTLAIVAPELSHFIVHPILNVLGFKDKKPEVAKSQAAPQLNAKA